MAPMAHDGALMMPDGADSRTDGAGVSHERRVGGKPREQRKGLVSATGSFGRWGRRTPNLAQWEINDLLCCGELS